MDRVRGSKSVCNCSPWPVKVSRRDAEKGKQEDEKTGRRDSG